MAFTEVVSAVVSGETVDGTQYIISGGETNSTLISGYYGVQYISSGGVANTTVIDSGMQYISSGGVANTTTIDYGAQYVESGGEANFTTLNAYSEQYVSSGGVANTTVIDSGTQYISSGGVANSTTIYRGTQTVYAGGEANFTTINSGGDQDVYNGIANSTTINSRGSQSVLSGGIANSTTINSGGYQSLVFDGVANNTTINSGGRQEMFSGGVANSTTLAGGTQLVLEDGVANETTVNANGSQDVWLDGHANNTIVNRNGIQNVYSGGVAAGTIVNSAGTQIVYSGGLSYDTHINFRGVQDVSSGGTASGTIINSGGGQAVYGVVVSTTVNFGGEQYIDGGSAYTTTINSGGSQFVLGLARSSTVESGGIMMIGNGGSALDFTVASGGIFGWDFNASFIGTSNGISVFNSDSQISYNFYLEMGSQFVLSGYTANSTTIYWGKQYISSGGIANSAVISRGSQYISSGGIANATTNYEGYQYVYSGGVANATVLDSHGYQVVYSGGVGNSTTINDGLQYVESGGIASAAVINNGSQWVSSGGVANFTVINGGNQWVSSGGVANSTVINGGYQSVDSGGVASNTTVNYGGSLTVVTSGSLAGILTIAGGHVTFYNASAADTLTTISYELENAQANDVLLSLWSGALGAGGTTYTLNLDDAALGTYILCSGDLDDMSDKAFTVTDNDQTVSITVGSSYTFANGDILSLEISEGSTYLRAIFSVESTPPSEPGVLSAVVTSDDVALDWGDSTDNYSVSSYTVEYSTAADFTGAVSASTSVSELDLTDLVDGIYHWRVKSVDNHGNESDWTSGSDFTVDITAPDAPDELSDSVAGTNVELDWADAVDNVTGIKEYIVEYADNNLFTNANSQTVDSSNLDVSGLTDLTTYYWRVKVVDNNDNESEWSATEMFDIDTVASSDPAGLDADVTGNDVSLDWADSTDSLSGVAGYTIEYTTDADFSSASSQTATVSELDLTDLADGVYHWRVKSVDENGNESAWTEGADFTVDTTAPDVPFGLNLSFIDVSSMTEANLSWEACADNLSGTKEYVVEYWFRGDYSTAVSYTVSVCELFLSDLDRWEEYVLQIKAIDNYGNESAWSDEIWFSTEPYLSPDGPFFPTNSVNEDSVSLDWENVSWAEDYIVEYAQNSQFTDAISITVSQSDLDLTGLTDMTTYYWRVKTVYWNGYESHWSSTDTFSIDIPDTAAPSTPTDLTDSVSGSTASLDWSNSTDNKSGVENYVVQYASNSQFTGAVSRTVTDSAATLSGLTDTTYYWRVKAVDNNDNESEWSATEMFDIDTVASSDPAGLDADVTGNDVSLDWADSTDSLSGVAGYTIEYTTDADFSSASSQTATVSELDLTDLADGVYHWRVKSVDENGNESGWTSGDDFTVDTTAPATPDGLSGSVAVNSASLDWDDSSDNLTGIKEYVVEYADNDQFTGATSQTVVASELDLTSLSDGTYYWRVKTIDNNDNESGWSSVETFDVDTTASSDPAGLDVAVTGNDVSLDWTDSTDNLSGVAGYTIEYTTDDDFDSASSQTATVSELDLTDLADGVYHWRVKSVDENGNESAWTEGADFTVDTTAPATPDGLSGSVTTDSASLDWDDSSDNVTGIKEYVVEYADNDQFTGASSQTVVSSELDLTSLSDGTYYWRVKVIDNNDNESEWSASETFDVDTTASSDPTGLDAAVTGNDVSLDWADSTDGLSGLAGYTIEYTIDADFSSASSQTISVSELDLTDLADGVYHWRVKSVDENGNESGWTEGEVFTVDITAPDVPSSLDAAVIGDDVSLDWADANDNLTGTKEYVIEYTTDDDFDSASSQTISVSELDLTDLADGVYHWRVKSVDENGNESDWTEGTDFTVDITAPDVPSSLDATVVGDDVSLDWADANDNLTGTKEYVIEYTTDDDFDSASSQTISVSELDLTDLADGVYHWRVKSVDENGNESAWTEGDDFMVDITAPDIPAGLTVTVTADSALLDWNDLNDNLTGIKEYVVEYADNDQFTGASSQTVSSSELDLSSLSDGTYYWRVKVIDNNDNASEWSAAGTFDVDTTSSSDPTGLDAAATGNDVSLDWADALDNFSGVAGYTVEYTTDADFSSVSSLIVGISELELSGLADGIYYWRVKSVDNNGNESSWTTGYEFTIDVTAPDAPSSLDAVVTGNDAALDWQDALDNLTGIDEYIVEYSINVDFSDSNIESTTGSNLDLAGLTDGVYYWRVKSVDGSGNESEWSDGDEFMIDVTAPTTPDNLVETLQGENIVLDWDDVSDNLSGVESYLVEYADNAEFDNAVSQTVTDSVLNISDLSYGTWFWRVRSVDNFGNQSEWSSQGTFDTGDTSGNTHDLAKTINVDEAYHYDEYVGQGDACDMYSFDVASAGEFDLSISNLSAKAKLNIYVWNGKKYKKIKSAGSKFNKITGQIEAHIDNLMLDEDTYYVEVISGDKGKGKCNTEYSLDITPSYFPEATDNNSWETATEITLDFNMENGFVGFGDAVDYYKFEVDSLDVFDFELAGDNKNAKMTVYKWDDNKDKYKKVASARLKNGDAMLDNISLDAGLYYVEVLSKDKGKGKYNTEYELNITTA